MAQFCSDCGRPIETNAKFCTHCGASLTGKAPAKPNWQEKRERVLGKQQSSDKSRLKTFIIVGVVAAFAVWLYLNLPESGNPIIKVSPIVTEAAQYPQTGQQMAPIAAKVEDGKIIIPLNVVKEKKFVKFSYGDQVNGLPLLAYVSGEGKIVTAVSVCEPCNSTDFHISADMVVCNACGSTWEVNTLEAVSGACGRYPPDAVPNTVVGNEIQIDEKLVARWQRRI